MKKKYLLVLAIITILLTACSKGKKLECIHTEKNESMEISTTHKYVFSQDGKKVKNASTKIEYTFKEEYLKFLKDNDILLKDSINFDSICDSYKTIEGSVCKIEYLDDKVIINIDLKDKKSFDGDYDFFKEYYEGIKYECK